MGIYGHRFYFKKGLPKVSEIKEKFKEITGLYLDYTPVVHLNELMTDHEDILYHLAHSNGRSINRPFFSCADFDRIYLGDYMDTSKNSFHIEAGIRMKSMYFFFAFIKTIHEIGGHTFNYHVYPYDDELVVEDYLAPYHPCERKWKRIKKWDTMAPVEKASFKGKYA